MSSNIEILDFWTCIFLDPPSTGNFTPANSTKENLIFYECHAYGKYIFGTDSFKLWNGYFACVIVCIVTVLVGTFGIFTNVLNVIVLRKSHKKKATVKYLLIILAIVEFVACCSGIFFSFMIVCILGNLSRSKQAYQWFRVASIISSLSRTASIYVTILTTIERYIAVAFPHKSKTWLAPSKTYLHVTVVGVITLILNISLILNPTVSAIDANDVFPANTHVEHFPYIFKDDHFTSRELYETLVVLNYVAPFPLQLMFNGLLFKSIFDWRRRTRVRTSGSHKNEVNVAKMFCVVVLIVLSCHTMSCIIFFVSRFVKLIYRELILVQLLCVVVGASTNFIVYYCFGKDFKRELHKLFENKNILCCCDTDAQDGE